MVQKNESIEDLLKRIGQDTAHFDLFGPPPTVNQIGGWGDPPLTITVTWNEPETTQLLIDNGADVNARGDLGETALHKAVSMGRVNIVRVLLENGADTQIKSVTDMLPIDYARGNREIIELLERYTKK